MKSLSSGIYFYLITFLFIIGISFLPQGIWNFIPVVYALSGPVLFGIFYRRRKTKFDDYFFEKYPDLAAKSAVQYGVMKGIVSNPLDLYSNRKDLFKQEDEHLNELFTATFQMGRFSIYSFLMLVMVSVIVSLLRTF